jgi:hypothetical protein
MKYIQDVRAYLTGIDNAGARTKEVDQMRLPGMTSELSLQRRRSLHGATVEQPFTKHRSTIVPARNGSRPTEPFDCASGSGPCTTTIGVGWIGTRPPSTVTVLGVTASCNGDFQYPWITVCRGRRTGRVTSNSGCGFCLW